MDNVEIWLKEFPSKLIDKDWSTRRFFMRSYSPEFMQALFEFEVRQSDVWIVTLPKCGTTWMQELTWLVAHDFNFERALAEPLELRSPFIEFPTIINIANADSLNELNQAPRDLPRVIKSHMCLPLLPPQVWSKKPKLIYVFRHPKEYLVSFYHFVSHRKKFDGTLEEFVKKFLKLQQQQGNNFWQHVLEFYHLRNENWIYYTSFENLKSNLRAEIENVCKFLNKTISEQQMQQMLQHLDFKAMKANPQTNHSYEMSVMNQHNYNIPENKFYRKGETDSYKTELSPESSQQLDQWINDALKAANLTLNDLLRLNH